MTKGLKVGRRARYVTPVGVELDVWITAIWSDGRVNLRHHRTSQKDIDFKRAPYSATRAHGHWSWRSDWQ